MTGFNPVPKPDKPKKKKKLCNGYKDKPNRRCLYCNETSAERHEIFGGNPNRQHSIEDGLQIDVCRRHHEELQANVTPWAQEENRKLKEWGQQRFELHFMTKDCSQPPRPTPIQARSAFRKRYGKSYLPLLE